MRHRAGISAAVLVVAPVLVPAARAGGGVPVQLAYCSTALWAVFDSGVRSLDPLTGRTRSAPRTTYAYATGVAVGDGAAWVASVRNRLAGGAVDRVDLKTRRRTVALRSPRRGIYGIAYAAHSLWVLLARPVDPTRFEVARLDTRSGSRRYFEISGRPGWITASATGLWISGDQSLRLVHRNGSVARIASVPQAGPLTTSGGSVWISSRHSLLRFDEHSRRRLTTVHLGAPTSALAAAAGRVWATVTPRRGAFISALLRVDARKGRITGRLVLSRSAKKVVEPTAIAANRAYVWLGGVSGKELGASKCAGLSRARAHQAARPSR